MNINLDYKDIPLTEIEKIYSLKYESLDVTAYCIPEHIFNNNLRLKVLSLYDNITDNDIFIIAGIDDYAASRNCSKYVLRLEENIFNHIKPKLDKLKKLQVFI